VGGGSQVLRDDQSDRSIHGIDMCVCMYVCMYVCTYVRTYVCMYLFIIIY
jgi:hypothetical protein